MLPPADVTLTPHAAGPLAGIIAEVADVLAVAERC
jgi:hypothetical protein